MNTVNSIIKNDLCSGCGACEIVCPKKCISIVEGDRNIANINMEACIHCGLCKKVCPSESNKNILLKNEDIDFEGVYKKCFIGESTDNELRFNSSSGGVVRSIVKYMLEKKIVDGAIMVKGSEINALRNKSVLIENVEELNTGINSRYSPASACLGIKNILLDKEKKYVFIGKPCEVKALREICKINKRISNSIYLAISIMCFQTPSLKGTLDILKKHGEREEDVVNIKYRGNGWPGYFICETKNTEIKMTYLDAWNNYICKNGNIGCKTCVNPFAKEADIVVGDPWNDDYKEETIGKTACIVRSDRANKIITDMEENNDIRIKVVDMEYIKSCQKQLLKKINEITFIRYALAIVLKEKFIIRKVVKEYKLNLSKYLIFFKKFILFKDRIRRQK